MYSDPMSVRTPGKLEKMIDPDRKAHA